VEKEVPKADVTLRERPFPLFSKKALVFWHCANISHQNVAKVNKKKLCAIACHVQSSIYKTPEINLSRK